MLAQLFLTLLAAMWLGGRLAAQEVTGSLRGRVVGASGQPAEGGQVTVSGRDLLGTRTAATDRDGYFQILALPPGEYSVRIIQIGARPVTIERVGVDVGRTTALRPVILEAQPVQLEPLLVLAGRQSIDPTHTDVGGTLTAADYAALPVDRDYKSIIAILPHANESARGDPVNVAGSTGLENMYFIDGVNVTSTLNANTGTSLPYNFVRAVEVKTGGYEAQYGNALGAVVNAVTYSGTNDLEGNVFAFATHSALAATPKAQPTLRENQAFSYDVGVRLSGPVARDRLWYSAAYNPRVERADREIQGHGPFTDKRSAHIFAGKLTWQARPSLNVEFSLFGDPTVQDAVRPPIGGVVPAGYTALNPDPYLVRLETGGIVGSLRMSATLGDWILLEGTLARSTGRENDVGATAIARTQPFFLDYAAGAVSGGGFITNRSDLGRWIAALRGTMTFGRHAVVAGGGYEDVTGTRDLEHPGGYSVERNSGGNYIKTEETARGEFHNRVPTAFLQDSWRLTDRLTLNAGLRWSAQILTGASGKVAQRFPGEWQPRLGLIWQPDRSGTDRVFASAGRFYQQEPLGFSTLNFADLSFIVSYYSVNPQQPGAISDSTPIAETIYGDSATSIPGLKVEHFDEFTLGYERLVGSATKVTARVIRRDLRSSFQWGFGPSGFVIGTPGKGDFAFLPKPVREYTALELSAEGSWRDVTYRASYVLSRNWGNYPGLYDSDLGIATPGGVRTFIAPWQAVNSTGLLPNDRTHVFKLSASRTASFGLTIGAAFTWASGSPLNAFAVGPGSIPVFRAFAVPRGSVGRTPSLLDLDLRLAYDLKLSQAARSRIVLDVFHVGNPQRAVQLEELRYLGNDNGVFTVENSSYGVAVGYQPPMMARLGVEVGF